MIVYNNQQQLTGHCSFQEYSVLLQSPPRNNGNQGQHAIIEINTFMSKFTSTSGLSIRVVSQKGYHSILNLNQCYVKWNALNDMNILPHSKS